MFKKVLIAEDQDDINIGLHTELKKLGILEIDQVKYCDDAYLKIQRGIFDKKPYDILITDLSFEADYREQDYKSGEELVRVLRKKQIEIPIVVYSVEDNSEKVRRLIHTYNVNGYVCKGRKGTKELIKALYHVYKTSAKYLSPKVANAKQNTINNDITDYDTLLLKKLSEGLSQKQISQYFLEHEIIPSSLSSVEKRLNKLKDILRANNPAQLIAIAKDAGFI